MIENFGLNTDALNAEIEYRRTTRVRSGLRRPLPRLTRRQRAVNGR